MEMEKLSTALTAIRNLRIYVRLCFEKLADGNRDDVDFIQRFQDRFNDVHQQIKYFK